MPRLAETEREIAACFDVMAELRPQLQRESFPALVGQMRAEGYRLAYSEHAGQVVTVAGFRISTNLALGRNLYVDDLVTAAAARSGGHGAAMLDWLRRLAQQAGCRYLHLDSGVQRHRAHGFYFRHGFHIAYYHFCERLDQD
jgi:GNAT superfamily N-acetyltransferase